MSYSIFLIPIVFLFNFLFSDKKNYFLIAIIFVVLFLIEFIPTKTIRDPFSFLSLSLTLFSFPVLVNQVKKMPSAYLNGANEKLNKLEKDLNGLEIKIREIDEKIQELEKENANMTELYDMTKEMSKVLSFKDMFRILQSILQRDFSFEKGFLVTLRFELNSFQINKIYALSSIFEEDLKEIYLPQKAYYKVIERLFQEGGSFYFDEENSELKGRFGIDVKKPFAVSTLKVGNRVIGFLILEGLKKEEFSKFSIFITQLSLELRRVILYENMERMATTDSLTGLYVRKKIIDSLELEIERAQKHNLTFAFLMLDIDHFKKCNDYFGHLTGDYVLREISRILKTNLREIDLVGRYGGEEIAILLLNTKEEEARIVAERIREVIAGYSFKAYGEKFNITVSIGGTIFPKDGDSPFTLINNSDEALYSAKRGGRNCVIFYSDIKKK